MTPQTCHDMVADYIDILKDDFHVAPSDSGCMLATPFIRPDGEGIEIELEALPDGRVRIGDMGDTLGYLYVNGMTLSRNLIADARRISKPYDVSLTNNELSVTVEPESLGRGVHGLIQAIISVTDLIQKRRPTSRVNFDDEVESLIIHSGVTYDVGFEVSGEREVHTIKFHVDSGRALLIHPLTAADISSARSRSERLAYRFTDILAAHSNWDPVVVLDDRGQRSSVWSRYAVTPVEEYSILWSKKEELEEKLTVTSARL